MDAYTNRDFKTALEEWLPLAEEGDAVAQNSVGALYDRGLGVDENDEEAVRWYQAAADQDLPLAMRNLANMYAGDHGVPFDQAQADYWYQKAADAGDPAALKRLGMSAPPTPQTTEAPAAVEPMQVEPDTEMEAVPAEAPVQAPALASVAEALAEEPAPEAEATTEEPVAEEPVAEEPVAEEPVAEEPAVEEPAISDASAVPDPATDSGEAPQYGDSGSITAAPATSATASTDTSTGVQQASVATPAPPADPSNWLIGMWQGPSLGCPPGGGLEFAAGETRSYYQGKIAATLKVAYTVDGDVVTVVDGVGRTFEYQQTGPSTFVIKSVPAGLPESMIGIEHRRCGGGPVAVAAPKAPTQQATVPTPAPTAAPAVVAAPAQPANPAQSASTVSGTAQDGWEAFGRGDYDGALAIWQPMAEQGDINMQLLVGSIYDLGQGVPQDDLEAVKWYEMAAKRGSAKGQYQLGAVYARSAQAKDPFQAYKWLSIAARTIGDGGSKDGITADQATTLRHLVEFEMSKDDIAKAQAEAKAFKIGG